tara:strand:- start:2752 stop:3510 length:759 start_codon:yes stop_codon:yes gene_type:complete
MRIFPLVLHVKYISFVVKQVMNFISTKFRPVYISRRQAPEVEFRDVDEFTTCQSEFVSSYSKLITDVFQRAFDCPQGNTRLVWTDRDMILYGMAEFPRLNTGGVNIMLQFTKGRGIGWCIAASAWMADMVTAGCRGHARALMDWPVNTPEMNDIYSRTLRQEMLSGMYDNLGIFDHIFDASFVGISHPATGVVTTYLRGKWREIMLAFSMITHDRLCQLQSCHALDPFVVRMILEFVVRDSNLEFPHSCVFE